MGSVDTLASGRVVVSNDDPSEDRAVWELRERVRLGSLDTEGPELFGAIGGIGLGPDGEIYVLDGQAADVRVFDSEGAFLLRFGGQGEGPGELDGAAGLTVAPNEWVWIVNWGNARYSAFDPSTGEVSEEVRRPIGFAQFPWPGDVDDEGRFVDVGLDRTGEVAVMRLDPPFAPTDTLALPQPNEGDRISFRRGTLLVASMLEPFAPSPSWAPRRRGGIVVGEGSAYRLHRIGFDGDTTMTFELDRKRVAVTPLEADSALDLFREMQESLGGVTPNRRPSVHDVKPAHGPLFVDDQDRTWVLSVRATGEGAGWDVFDRDGRLLGFVKLPTPPSSPRPVVRGDRLALDTQVNGFPEVVVYDIVSEVRPQPE